MNNSLNFAVDDPIFTSNSTCTTRAAVHWSHKCWRIFIFFYIKRLKNCIHILSEIVMQMRQAAIQPSPQHIFLLFLSHQLWRPTLLPRTNNMHSISVKTQFWLNSQKRTWNKMRAIVLHKFLFYLHIVPIETDGEPRRVSLVLFAGRHLTARSTLDGVDGAGGGGAWTIHYLCDK